MTAVAELPPQEITEIRPHDGPQTKFLETNADIAIYGGAAGGGKTRAILMEPIRHVMRQGFNAVIFRRNCTQITNPGALWDESADFYQLLGGTPRRSSLQWSFENMATIKFAHMQYENDKYAWQGAQLAFIGFDELTHFTEGQFWYLTSRLRTMCGMRPYLRATCNPDPDSFVRELIDWWLDENGDAIPERSGVVRWFAREDGKTMWSDDKWELVKQNYAPQSFTFIASNVYDNPTMLEANPGYVSSLKALASHERARLLEGNWNARAVAGELFKKIWFDIQSTHPARGRLCRFWDKAATEPNENNKDPDWTVGILMMEHKRTYYVIDMIRFRATPGRVEAAIVNTAAQDNKIYGHTKVRIEHEGGSAGKADIDNLVKALAGYDAKGVLTGGKNKIIRATPVSAQAEMGNIVLIEAPWNKQWLDAHEAFPNKKIHDDEVDATSGAFNELALGSNPFIGSVGDGESSDDYYNYDDDEDN